MSKYQLTEKQKDLLRSIAPGLQDGTVSTEWTLLTGDDRILAIHGLNDDGSLWQELWEGIKHSDFDDFEEYGFFRPTKWDRKGIKEGYSLHTQRILDAVESNFGMSLEARKPLTEQELLAPVPTNTHIFISYSHKDRKYAHDLAEAIEQQGFIVWIDDRIDYGTQWPHVIQEQLDGCGAFILIMTTNSYQSQWVQNELNRATRKGKAIFPLLLEGDVWLSVEAIQYIDVTNEQMPDVRFYRQLAGVVPKREQAREQKIDEIVSSMTQAGLEGKWICGNVTLYETTMIQNVQLVRMISGYISPDDRTSDQKDGLSSQGWLVTRKIARNWKAATPEDLTQIAVDVIDANVCLGLPIEVIEIDKVR